jgi:hypothetical protein
MLTIATLLQKAQFVYFVNKLTTSLYRAAVPQIANILTVSSSLVLQMPYFSTKVIMLPTYIDFLMESRLSFNINFSLDYYWQKK